ncbi:MAG: ABC transporter ATP-binding protein [Chloroflexi bacterium]|nr:ABC transporter ATP-binding protein [Chloroflexota bacterium]
MVSDKVLLSCKNLDIRYDGVVRAVRGISIEVNEGEFVSIIGSNGAGKSTTLKAISGINKLYDGEIWFDGKRIDGMAPYNIIKLGLAHTPEGRLIFPYLSVRDNLLMGAYIRKDNAAVDHDIEKMFDRWPILRQKEKQMGGELSGGQQMILAIARSLMTRPKMLLMDAPSQGLAPLVIKEVASVLSELNKEGLAVLLVDQNARLCLRLAQRAYLFEVGQVVMTGTGAEMSASERVQKSYLGVD